MGRFLLDTHGFLWLIQGDPQLSERARSVISDDANQLYFSVASREHPLLADLQFMRR